MEPSDFAPKHLKGIGALEQPITGLSPVYTDNFPVFAGKPVPANHQ